MRSFCDTLWLLELLAALAGEVSARSNKHIFWARQYKWASASELWCTVRVDSCC
jgi:hypothetical protein